MDPLHLSYNSAINNILNYLIKIILIFKKSISSPVLLIWLRDFITLYFLIYCAMCCHAKTRNSFLFRPLLRGEELYTQMGFFCSVNFGRSIYSSKRVETGIIRKLVQCRMRNKEDFFDFRFWQGDIEV